MTTVATTTDRATTTGIDAATIDALREEVNHYRTLCEQLQRALDSRVTIEQAKGVLAERYQIDVDEAFVLLRSYCHANDLRLTAAARAVTATSSVA